VTLVIVGEGCMGWGGFYSSLLHLEEALQ